MKSKIIIDVTLVLTFIFLLTILTLSSSIITDVHVNATVRAGAFVAVLIESILGAMIISLLIYFVIKKFLVTSPQLSGGNE